MARRAAQRLCPCRGQRRLCGHAGIADVVGQKVREMVPDEADGWVELYGAVLRTGEPIRFERELVATGRIWNWRPSGSDRRPRRSPCCSTTSPRKNRPKRRWRSSTPRSKPGCRGMAERKHAEDALRQAQKMEAVGQLTGGIAHDFNNLLTGIIGALELLQHAHAPGPADRGRPLSSAAAQGAAKRAAALTHRLLAFSRRQTLDPKPIDVNRLIGGMEELIRRTLGPQIAVEVVRRRGLWPTLSTPTQLENALLNLCINARDAMPDGGTLTIETANKWLDDRAARERDLPPGQYVSLCVTDTGTGMTPDVIARAFDPFFTTKPIGQGTGLGLSMIYGFARQSGGQVRIYSEVGQGTTMCLYLPAPLRRGGGRGRRPARAEPIRRAARGETVLVVDDEPTVRMLIAEVLRRTRLRLIEAARRPVGAARSCSRTARIDLLVTDVGLPGGMNGRQLADAARHHAAGAEGAVHHRLCRERRRRQRTSGARHGGADEALCGGDTGEPHPGHDRRRQGTLDRLQPQSANPT